MIASRDHVLSKDKLYASVGDVFIPKIVRIATESLAVPHELNPETRARVLKEIEEAEAGTTALAIIKPKNHPSVEKPSSQLAKLEQARQMLAESRTLSEVKQTRDIAEAARVYAKAANLGHEAQNYAAEIALLAARKAGDILQQLAKGHGPGRGENNRQFVGCFRIHQNA